MGEGASVEPVDSIEPQAWMTEEATQAVFRALQAKGSEARFVGGCVRDAVAGRKIGDIDIATPDKPEEVIALLEAAGLKAIPTGLAHGTVTAVSHHHPFEITTLREDVETYGRHATVAFTDDWKADAARRDFTMNALSLSLEGALYDPFEGLADLAAGRIRFVGDPVARIREDYLRILRFFRFQAHFGRIGPDRETLEAITVEAPGIDSLSGERLRSELLKLLRAPDPYPAVESMRQCGVLAHVLPEAQETDSLRWLLGLEDGRSDALMRLASLLPEGEAAARATAARLRLSNAERDSLVTYLAPGLSVGLDAGKRDLRYAAYRLGRTRVLELLMLAAARRGGDTAGLAKARERIAGWQDRPFPLQGRDLLDLGYEAGPGLGQALKALEAWWIDADYQPGRPALLQEAERRLSSRHAP